MTDQKQLPSYMPATIAYLPPAPIQGANESLDVTAPYVLANPIIVGYSERDFRRSVSFMLTGASDELAEEFVKEILNELRQKKLQLRADWFYGWLTRTASKMASRLFPGRDFTLEDSAGELQLATTGAVATEEAAIQATVQAAADTAAPLEFVYLSARSGKAFQTLRRVNVLKVYPDGFLAKHARGYRRYSFKRLSHVAVGRFAETVGHEPVVTVHHEAWNYGLVTLEAAKGELNDG